MLGEKVRPWRGRRDRLRHDDGRRRLLDVAALAPPLEQDLVGVEPEIERVVAQEALRVDRAGELLVVAALQRAQVACPDLRVALGAIEIDALALARGVEALRKARTGIDASRRGRRRTDRPSPPASAALASSSVIPVEAVVQPTRSARLVTAKDLPGVRPVERPDVAARLQLIDHPRRPRVADLEAALEERC